MTSRYVTAFLLCLAIGIASAERQIPKVTLPVPSVGFMRDITGAHEKPDPSLHYKLLFDVQTLADSPDQASPALDAIGGLLNTLAEYGVPRDHIEATAIFHGKSIVLVTGDEAYQRRTGVAKNPNAGILGELAEAGVTLAVCGQSERSQHYVDQDLRVGITVNLSATVTLVNLETRGFVRVEE